MNQDFYPTPKKLIKKMLEGVKLEEVACLLEPSAGKGDICDYVKNVEDKVEMDVVEIEEDLQALLKGKKYNLVFNDFLNFNTHKKYDLILANFPFSNGDEHLKKAIELQERYGGSIVCLVNAETIKNPYTSLRKTIGEKLNKYNAKIEYLQQEFIDAERKTDVEVALIRLSIDDNTKSFLILDHLKKSESVKIEEKTESQIISKDFIQSLITRFNLESKLGINLITEYFALKPYILEKIAKNDEEKKYNDPIIKLEITGAAYYRNDYINQYVKQLRLKYWRLLLSNEDFISKYTSNIRAQLNEKLNTLEQCDFSLFNIRELEKELNKKIVLGIEDAILNLFDDLSHKYMYSEEFGKNIHYYNGWKSNKAYKINKKVILPINGFSSYSWKKNQIDDYYVRDKISDMVKVFNYLAPKLDSIGGIVSDTIGLANHTLNFNNMDFYYFTCTFYKKGTCHITFKDDELLKKFNIYGSQRKGWLPPSYAKKRYQEMSEEEKKIVDEFQGEEDYDKVINNKDYYLVQTNSNYLLTA